MYHNLSFTFEFLKEMIKSRGRASGLAQVVEHLPSKFEVEFNPQ
jgi:hypothetical protein